MMMSVWRVFYRRIRCDSLCDSIVQLAIKEIDFMLREGGGEIWRGDRYAGKIHSKEQRNKGTMEQQTYSITTSNYSNKFMQ